jgi:hypothetical protein
VVHLNRAQEPLPEALRLRAIELNLAARKQWQERLRLPGGWRIARITCARAALR